MKQLPKVAVFHIFHFFGVEVFATFLRPLVVVFVTADGQLGDGSSTHGVLCCICR